MTEKSELTSEYQQPAVIGLSIVLSRKSFEKSVKNPPKTVKEQPEGILLRCKCGYSWLYRGSKRHPRCPRCTRVVLNSHVPSLTEQGLARSGIARLPRCPHCGAPMPATTKPERMRRGAWPPDTWEIPPEPSDDSDKEDDSNDDSRA